LSSNNFKLYVDSNFLSPYAMSVFVTLMEKGVPFAIKTIDLGTQENRQLSYANLSLTSRVPMLTHDDFHLSESSAISEYLEELFPPPQYQSVYPIDRQERAKARQIQAWLRSDLLLLKKERSAETVFCKHTNQPLSEFAQIEVQKLFTAANGLLPAGAQNLFGEWCIADTDLAMVLNRLVLNGDNVSSNLAAYAEYQWQRPTVQLWVEQQRSH
jgi:glutathione S-transferase